MIGLTNSLLAQNNQVHIFDTSPIPEHIQKLKPYRDVHWSRGTINIKSGKEITGYLCYVPRVELVLSYKDGKIQTYTPLQIQKFGFFDQILRCMRHYQSIPVDSSADSRRYQIYEVITTGNFNLVRKETSSIDAYSYPTELVSSKLTFDYYIWDKLTLWPYRKFEKRLLPALGSENDEIEKYVGIAPSKLTVGHRRRMTRALNRLISEGDQTILTLAKK